MAGISQGPAGTTPNRAIRGAFRAAQSVARGGIGVAKGGYQVAKGLFSGPGHEAGMTWAKDAVGLGKGGMFGKLLGAGFTAYSAYEGFQEEGLWGAAKGAGGSIASQYLMGRAIHSLAVPAAKFGAVAAGIGLVAAGAYSAYQGISYAQSFRGLARPWLMDHYRKHAKLELGSPVLDPFGTAATMRQRSIAAIQGSRLNGRTALGNEAMLLSSIGR